MLALAAAVFLASTAGADDFETGRKVYEQTCVACHGARGRSPIPGVVNLSRKSGVLTKTDEELFAAISDGLHEPGVPLAMPAKGGNPELSDEDIRAVIRFLKVKFQ